MINQRFKQEMVQAQEQLNNDHMCLECGSSKVAQVSFFICHCRDCDNWYYGKE